MALGESAELVGRVPVGGGMSLVTLRGASSLHGTYTRPGQYTEIILGGEAAFFVIANRVGSPAWELVLRGGGGAADTLLSLSLGSVITIAPALGHGFPCEEARRRPLVVAVNGTGIAAARPVLATRIDDGDAPQTEVFVGARTRAEMALTDEVAEWGRRGARVTTCLSQGSVSDDGSAPSTAFAEGYVQDVVRARDLGGAVRGGMIFAVGAQPMVDALRDLAPAIGIAVGDVRTNY